MMQKPATRYSLETETEPKPETKTEEKTEIDRETESCYKNNFV